MLATRSSRWSSLAVSLGVIAAVVLVQGPTPASAATPLTVAQAIGQQNGSSATVRGYVVGQPTAASTVVRSNFPSDTAIALADTATETGTSRMIYVQVTSAFRASYGLRANPGLLGTRLDVTGKLGAYFTHAGLTSPTAITPSGTTTPPPPTTSTSPPPVGSDDYYRDAIGKTGPALKAALHGIIKNGTKLSYDQVWEALKVTDEDPNNSANVMLFYENRSLSKSASGGNPDDWNREHVWAKSHGNFGTATGPGTDVHHLRPTDVTVNSTRGNKDFDMGGSPVGEAPGNFTDADSWEPANFAKGDVARMIFYMAVRYAGGDGFADLEVNNSVNNGTNPFMGKLSVLKQWSEQDPPDAFEKRRNQLIFERFQHNRNPFIDHPEWVNSIWP
nr:endonuclease [Allokutzneria sp. A3M-2-11 16]